VFGEALNKARPLVEVKSRRVGGATTSPGRGSLEPSYRAGNALAEGCGAQAWREVMISVLPANCWMRQRDVAVR